MSAAGDGNITHRNVEVNGVRLHVAEAGPAGAPVALLLHGFPELWYTWRHQMPALAAAGYRAVAPDLRGYGDSDAPAGGPSKYTALHVVGDLVALIDSLGQEQVFVVAHDWGALIAWYMCLFRPDKVRALVAMSVAFFPRDPAQTLVEAFRSLYGDEYYVWRFQEPGEMEAEFARLGTELVLRKFLAYRTAEPLLIPKSGWGSPNDKIPLPSWISDEDIKYYTSQFEKTGFTGGLNYYRALDRISRGKFTVAAITADDYLPMRSTEVKNRTSSSDIKSLRVITGVKTTYLPDGRFDLEAYDSLINMQIDGGAEGVIVC